MAEPPTKLEPTWMSNTPPPVSLELSLLSGTNAADFVRMLGGSAPSPLSSATYRTESSSKSSAWSASARLNHYHDLRAYSVYSLIPHSNNTTNNNNNTATNALYFTSTKAASAQNKDLSAIRFVPNFLRVSETIYSSEVAFTPASPGMENEPEMSQPGETTKPTATPATTEEKKEGQDPARESVASASTSGEVINIKKETEEEIRVKKGKRRNVLARQFAVEEDSDDSDCANQGAAAVTESRATEQRKEELPGEQPDAPSTPEGAQRSEDKSAAQRSSEPVAASAKETDNREPGPSDTVPRTEKDSVIKRKCNTMTDPAESGGDAKKQCKTISQPVKIEVTNESGNRVSVIHIHRAPASSASTSSAGGGGGTRNPPASSTQSTSAGKTQSESVKSSSVQTQSRSSQNEGSSRTTPVLRRSATQDPSTTQNLHVEVPPVIIKREPYDFNKNTGGSAFLSPPSSHIDTNFLSPGTLSVLDSPILSPMQYPGNFDSSPRQRDSFLSPMDQNFFSPGQSFLGPRPLPESSFLGPSLDIPRFGGFSDYLHLPRLGGSFMMSGSSERVSEEVLLRNPMCLRSGERRRSETIGRFIDSSEAGASTSVVGTESRSVLIGARSPEVTTASSVLATRRLDPLALKQEARSAAAATVSTRVAQIPITCRSTDGTASVGRSGLRQACQQRFSQMKIPTKTVPSPPPVFHTPVRMPAPIGLPSAFGTVYAGGMMDQRAGNLITTWPAPAHNPALWQYPTPIEYRPYPPVGLQLVRDPITGHLLLIPTSNYEAIQRAMLWPNYQATSSPVIIPPLSIQPSTPHLVVDTNVPADYVTSETIRHSAPQHRILIDDSPPKRRTTPTDCPSTVVVSSCDSFNICRRASPGVISPVPEPVRLRTPAASTDTGRRSQATSPCLNPVPEVVSSSPVPRETTVDSTQQATSTQKTTTVTLQDACNQTEEPESEIRRSSADEDKDMFEPYTKTKAVETNVDVPKTQDVGTETTACQNRLEDKQSVLREIYQKREMRKGLSTLSSDSDPLKIKKEVMSSSQVDLSGLELLSNSIERFVSDEKSKDNEEKSSESSDKSIGDEERKDLSSDTCEGAVLLQNLKNRFVEVEEGEKYEEENSENMGGLGLLSTLAEQRFQEERRTKGTNEEKPDEKDESKQEQSAAILSCNFLMRKIEKVDSESLSDSDELPKLVRQVAEMDFKNFELTSSDEKKSGDDAEEGKRVVEEEEDKMSSIFFDDDDYEEKETETSSSRSSFERKLKRSVTRARLKEMEDGIPLPSPRSLRKKRREISPPVLVKETEPRGDSQDKNSKEVLKPPTLIPHPILNPALRSIAESLNLTPCVVNLTALKLGSDTTVRTIEEPVPGPSGESNKRKFPDGASSSPAKKRKISRRSSSRRSRSRRRKNSSRNRNRNRRRPPARRQPAVAEIKEEPKEEEKKHRRIRPKLKAEAKVKEWTPVQDDESLLSLDLGRSSGREDYPRPRSRLPRKPCMGDSSTPSEDSRSLGLEERPAARGCILTADHLNSERFPMRTLTVMGGLFYAGQLIAIRPPDVYGVTIDGERGNRPHIYSREEILKDSILEVKPEKVSQLTPGTRCCAYWSDQYRCLYPGTVSVPASPDPSLDEKFVNVEFDDGDSGRINIDDIRLLPEDYPVVEYDPNPLQSLIRRKRRMSGTSVESQSKDRKTMTTDSSQSFDRNESNSEKASEKAPSGNEETEKKKCVFDFDSDSVVSLESIRRELKRKRREKLKRLQSLMVLEKKRKKHKCSEERRHHKHHKKHRKHKHKHEKKYDEDGSGDTNSEDKTEDSTDKDREEESTSENSQDTSQSSDSSGVLRPSKKGKDRTESVESRSKMAAFLPARQLWGWCGKGFKRPGAKGRARKEFYRSIQRGKERITVGDCAVFLSTGRPDRPYIGRIESMWESWGTNMIVRVKWFYHPEETVGCPATLEYPGALFESPHIDENDVQTISHKCEVLALKDYIAKLGDDPQKFESIYDNNDTYYLAGYYDPTNTTLTMEPGVK